MSELLELHVRTYIGKAYRDYLNSQNEDLPEGDEWKKDVEGEQPPIPKTYPSRILINPSKFLTAIETYSLEELAHNSEDPVYDSVDICMEDGIQLSVIGSLDDFYEKWKEFHKKN